MNVKGKRLLIVGAGRGQVGLYKAAKELGVHTIAGTPTNRDYPGIKLADEVCEMDISKPDEVLEKAKTLSIDGLATSCLDTGVPAIGKVCDALGLTGLTENASVMCGDKLKMKKAFMKNGVSTAQFVEISSMDDLENALETLKLPVIIKATDLQGSNGIYIAKTHEAAIEGFQGAMEKTRRDYCIVEQYIEGYEFGAQAFVYHGEVLFVMPHGDIQASGSCRKGCHQGSRTEQLRCQCRPYSERRNRIRHRTDRSGRRQLSAGAYGNQFWHRVLQNDHRYGAR